MPWDWLAMVAAGCRPVERLPWIPGREWTGLLIRLEITSCSACGVNSWSCELRSLFPSGRLGPEGERGPKGRPRVESRKTSWVNHVKLGDLSSSP